MSLKLLTIPESRELDAKTISLGFASSEELMRRAGKAIAEQIIKFIMQNNLSKEIILIAGKGNNGGDAFAAASFLFKNNFDPKIIISVPIDSIKNSALIHYNQMIQNPIPIAFIQNSNELKSLLNQFNGDVIVDGLLGTGFNPPLSDFYKEIINIINQTDFYILSIDIPSGMTLNLDDTRIDSDITFTIGSVKDVLIERVNINSSGKIIPLDIGFPKHLINEFSSKISVFTESDCKNYLRRRKRNAHKGDFGRVLIIGGQFGFTGAAILSAKGAQRIGSGLVTVWTDKKSRSVIHSVLPEVMTVDFDQLISKVEDFKNIIKKYDAICVGPGLGQNNRSEKILKLILETAQCPILLDADALNIMSKSSINILEYKQKIIMTPHPGEAARLMSTSIDTIENNRIEMLFNMQRTYDATVVLKGSNTLVGFGGTATLHLTGTPAMSQGGMGDVLSGIITGFVAQGLNIYDASNIGVALHGLSANDLENRICSFGFSAAEVADNIPKIVKQFGRILRST